MTETADYLTRLHNLSKVHLSIQHVSSRRGDSDIDRDEDMGEVDQYDQDEQEEREYELTKKRIEQTLRDICCVVREAENTTASNFAEIVSTAEKMLNDTMVQAYADEEYDFVPSFAHSEGNLVDEKNSSLALSNYCCTITCEES